MSSLWIAEPDPDQQQLQVAWDMLLIPCDVPSYGPAGVKGLEIGGGPVPRRLSFTQFDLHAWPDVFHSDGRTPITYDLGDARELPYADGTFDAVFASNLLEHFPADQTLDVLREWARVLKPHGALQIVVPNAMGILRDFFDDKVNWPDTAERILGSRSYEGNDHKTVFSPPEVADVIGRSGALELVSLTPSHSGGGVNAVATKLP